MTSPLRKVIAILLVFGISGCAQSTKKGPSPMRNEEIYSTQKLKVGLIDYGTDFNRWGVSHCHEEYQAVELLSEASLISEFRKEGLLPERLLEWGNDFSSFQRITGLHLLYLVYEKEGKRYLRLVNYLGRFVRTMELDVRAPRCEELLRVQQVVMIDSYPPIADVFIDGRKIGEAPVWTWLRQGHYKVECKLPDQLFKPIEFSHPGDVQVLCKRENSGSEQHEDNITMEEKAGSALVYIVGAAVSIAAIVLPILFLY